MAIKIMSTANTVLHLMLRIMVMQLHANISFAMEI